MTKLSSEIEFSPSNEHVTGDLLFYTYADIAYSMFAVPYAYFALVHNDSARVEILLEDLEQFRVENVAGISRLEELFPGRTVFRQSAFVKSGIKVWPNTLRFIESPSGTAEYVYIGDIDLLVMEDVMDVHLPLIERFDLPFSNIIRPATLDTGLPQLTGLHFCQYDLMYPLADISDLNLASLSDEHVLYCLMERRGHMVPSTFNKRPECGIHMSLSRDPLGRCTGRKNKHYKAGKCLPWSGREYYGKLRKLLADPSFRSIYFDFPYEFRCLFAVLESAVLGKHRYLHRTAASFMIDRSIANAEYELSLSELEEARTRAIDAGSIIEAERICALLNLLWPSDKTQWLKRSLLAFDNENERVGVEALLHLGELEGGVSYLARQEIVADHESVIRSHIDGKGLLERIDSWKLKST